jgi:hypothetical protein
MDTRRRGWLRPALVLGVLGAFAAAMLISPASAHITTFGHLKKHIKKIAKKVAKKEATTIVQTTVGPTVFIEETELFRSGPVTANSGETETLVEANGFRWELRCDATETAIDIENVSGGNDSAFDDNVGGPDVFDFDVGETLEDLDEATDNNSENGGTALFGSNGTVQYGWLAVFDRPATGFGGADCVAFIDLLVS